MERAHQVETTATELGRTFGPGRSVTGLEYERYFAKDGVDPFDEIEWELRSALIANERGELVFEQRDVEIPKSWSQRWCNPAAGAALRVDEPRPHPGDAPCRGNRRRCRRRR